MLEFIFVLTKEKVDGVLLNDNGDTFCFELGFRQNLFLGGCFCRGTHCVRCSRTS